jgi:catechol 2,3-dioxygenase-like lactoylglutathione lyase family enzyme
MNEAAAPHPESKAPINALVPMIRVAEVERSAKFYRLLGFEIGNYVPREAPPMHWAWLYQPAAPNWKTGANLMLVRGEEKSERHLPVVLYLYAADLVALRQQLIEQGISAGAITYPEYLPKGEFKLHDPDGYTVMVGQSYEESP